MAFILVLVQKPVEEGPREPENWVSFHAYAVLDRLKDTVGVFYINDTAWIFDTRKTLPVYGLVVHKANEFHVQLFSFQLHSEALQSLVVSYPQSEKLAKFLAS